MNLNLSRSSRPTDTSCPIVGKTASRANNSVQIFLENGVDFATAGDVQLSLDDIVSPPHRDQKNAKFLRKTSSLPPGRTKPWPPTTSSAPRPYSPCAETRNVG